MEADLRRVYGVRYSDRWRFDSDGSRRLTLREIWVMLQDLPGDARIVKHFNDGKPRWSDDTFLLADLIHVMSGKPHPARPKPKADVDRRETPRRQKIRRQRIAEKRRREMANRAAEAAD